VRAWPLRRIITGGCNDGATRRPLSVSSAGLGLVVQLAPLATLWVARVLWRASRERLPPDGGLRTFG
jgi:hypothetical protein